MSDKTPTLAGHDAIIRKLESVTSLTAAEIAAIRQLPLRPEAVKEGQDVLRQGDSPSSCCVILKGCLCRYASLSNGGRQIMSFHVPGDMPDLQSLHMPMLDHSIGALEASTVAFIPHSALADLMKKHPGVAAAFWRDTLIDAAIFREWLIGIGRRTAHARIAHLTCEYFAKMKAVGLTDGNSCRFPVTQPDLADALGLSPVHVNRVLQDLRQGGLIAFNRRVLTIPDWEALRRAADFDGGYLQLRRDRAA